MRVILGFVLFAFAASAGHAQSPRIDRLQLLAAGIFAGLGKPTVVEVTDNIPAKRGTTFGVEFEIIGSPKGAIAPLRVIWKYPASGITKPRTPELGRTKF